MKHKKAVCSTNIKDLEVPQTIFNPLCKEKVQSEVTYNKFSNFTFNLENAPIYEEERKKEIKVTTTDSISSKDSKVAPLKKVMRQPGFPLIIELKSKKNKNKSKKPKLGLINMPYKPKIEGEFYP